MTPAARHLEILTAAIAGGWRLIDRETAQTGTVYLHFHHPTERRNLSVRISDHPSFRNYRDTVHVLARNPASFRKACATLRATARQEATA